MRRTPSLRPALRTAVALSAAVPCALSLPATAAAPRGCEVISDPAGDADRVTYVGETPSPSSPAADVLSVRVWRDQRELHVSTLLSAAPNPDASSPSGYLYDVRASINGQEYSISADTTLDGQDYSLEKVTPPNSPPSATDGSPITGSFDLVAHTVTVNVPFSRLALLSGVKGRAFRLTDFRAFTMRAVGSALTGRTYTEADYASGTASFEVKSGTCR